VSDTQVALNPATLVELLRRGLRVGIPPTALANLFDLDSEMVRAMAVNIRRGRYGTPELSEALAFLTWEAYEEMLYIIRHGSPQDKLKATAALMGKALATAARQTPEEVERARSVLLAHISQDRILELEGEEEEDAPSAFVAVDERVDDQG
jgi:hypothetical protein